MTPLRGKVIGSTAVLPYVPLTDRWHPLVFQFHGTTARRAREERLRVLFLCILRDAIQLPWYAYER